MQGPHAWVPLFEREAKFVGNLRNLLEWRNAALSWARRMWETSANEAACDSLETELNWLLEDCLAVSLTLLSYAVRVIIL